MRFSSFPMNVIEVLCAIFVQGQVKSYLMLCLGRSKGREGNRRKQTAIRGSSVKGSCQLLIQCYNSETWLAQKRREKKEPPPTYLVAFSELATASERCLSDWPFNVQNVRAWAFPQDTRLINVCDMLKPSCERFGSKQSKQLPSVIRPCWSWVRL